jgi:hypothetical protein
MYWLGSGFEELMNLVCKFVILDEGIINSNLKALLLNPLKLISKEFQTNGDHTDLSAAEQIQNII